MGSGILFALFSLAVMGSVFMGNGDDTDTDSFSEPDEDIDDSGSDLGGDNGSDGDPVIDPDIVPGFSLSESGVLAGTEVDDVLTRAEVEAFRPVEISAGAGDDEIDLSPAEGEPFVGPGAELSIDLGEGDDTLTGPLVGSTVNGGAGNDVIDVVES